MYIRPTVYRHKEGIVHTVAATYIMLHFTGKPHGPSLSFLAGSSGFSSFCFAATDSVAAGVDSDPLLGPWSHAVTRS